MVVQLGQMQLPAPQDPDPSDDYFNGTIAGGGLWTALTRASDHDHTGGVNGKPISISSIPDGSITASKLDPSVLLPYALTDGSKPFTGTVSMNADAIVRDALFFGQQGSAGAADVSLTRTAAGVLRFDGGGSKAWLELRSPTSPGSVRIGQPVQGAAGGWLAANMDFDGTNWLRDDATKPAVQLTFGTTDPANGATAFSVLAVKPGANPIGAFLTRLRMDNTGTFTVTPDSLGVGLDVVGTGSFQGNNITIGPRGNNPGAGGRAIYYDDSGAMHWTSGMLASAGARNFSIYDVPRGAEPFRIDATTGQATFTPSSNGTNGVLVNGGFVTAASPEGQPEQVRLGSAYSQPGVYSNGRIWMRSETAMGLVTGNGSITVTAGAGNISLAPGGTIVHPATDNTTYCGYSNVRWVGGYTVSAFVVGSSADFKEDITPVAPAEGMDAVRNTQAVRFRYKAPPAPVRAPRPTTPYDWKAARTRMLADPLVAASREQYGFVLDVPAYPCDPRFATGPKQSNPASSIGLLLAAIKDLDTRLAALEGAA